NCPYSDQLLERVPAARKTAIPTRLGDPSPIKHVIYIIKENRTYDQVFGDVKTGNGDPSLVMFGADVTPNHHKLAGEFVLLDNLYCNGQVSRDGHPWSTMAYHTDYIARDWHLTYSKRKGVEDDDDAVHRDEPGRGPHRRHQGRLVHAAGVRRQQRPGAGPAGGRGEPLIAVEGDGDLRDRGRRPERPGPRGRPPHRRAGGLAVHEA